MGFSPWGCRVRHDRAINTLDEHLSVFILFMFLISLRQIPRTKILGQRAATFYSLSLHPAKWLLGNWSKLSLSLARLE